MSGIDLEDLRNNGGIIRLQNKDFVTFSGLLVTSHSNGLQSITPKLLNWSPEKQAAVFSATVSGERGTFTAHGDADPNNVKRGMVGAVLRMAETRAVCRALRMYLGIGMTAREELPGDEPAQQNAPRKAATHPSRQNDHPSWARDGWGFLEALKGLGLTLGGVSDFCADRKWGRPSEWTTEERRAFLDDLKAGKFPNLYKPAAS